MNEIRSDFQKLTSLPHAKAVNGGFMIRCPAHDDHNPSLKVALNDTGTKILAYCHRSCNFKDVAEALERTYGIKLDRSPNTNSKYSDKSRVKKAATFFYQNAEGNDVLKVERFEPPPPHQKYFKQWYWHKGTWHKGKPKDIDGKPIEIEFDIAPYNFRHWKDAPESETLYMAEGENCANALSERGLLSTCIPGGANGWKESYAKYFEGRTVCILPDNDEAGRKFARKVYASLLSVAKSVKVVELDGLGEKEDVVDWFRKGNTVDDLKKFVKMHDHTEAYQDFNVWTKPDLMFRSLDQPSDYPLEVLPTVLKRAVDAVSTFSKASPTASALVGIGTVSIAIGKKAMVEERPGLLHYPSLFLMGLAGSGERKSDPFKIMQKPLVDWEQAQEYDHKKRYAEVVAHNKLIKIRMNKLEAKFRNEKDESPQKLSSQISQLAALEEQFLPLPPKPRLTTNDCTEQKLFQLMHERNGTFAVSSGEGRPVIDALTGRHSDGYTGDSIYLAGITGDRITRDRVGGK